jgi:hypothetical protein
MRLFSGGVLSWRNDGPDGINIVHVYPTTD